ncbi:MAG TPA: AraC family transcriptional regulator [Acidobacteriaceae bacterium]|nr:AraC family transcriptional regulator [Acidobacteriaceae bacterium]
MVKIAVKSPIAEDQPLYAAVHRPPQARLLASGDGWKICDVVCGASPRDSAFEEIHTQTSIAIVASGTFQYRTATGCELMTPGSLLLGNSRDAFACGHDHSAGDRCISFHYSNEFCDLSGVDPDRRHFQIPRIPPIRALSSLVASVVTLLHHPRDHEAFREAAFRVFDRTARLQNGFASSFRPYQRSSVAGVARALRAIEEDPAAPHLLSNLAEEARLSPYHFLRTFENIAGCTPRQFLLRTRLRRAALRLKHGSARIIDIALDSGFGDVSNFNHAFRAEFGMSPRIYRSRQG